MLVLSRSFKKVPFVNIDLLVTIIALSEVVKRLSNIKFVDNVRNFVLFQVRPNHAYSGYNVLMHLSSASELIVQNAKA